MAVLMPSRCSQFTKRPPHTPTRTSSLSHFPAPTFWPGGPNTKGPWSLLFAEAMSLGSPRRREISLRPCMSCHLRSGQASGRHCWTPSARLHGYGCCPKTSLVVNSTSGEAGDWEALRRGLPTPAVLLSFCMFGRAWNQAVNLSHPPADPSIRFSGSFRRPRP